MSTDRLPVECPQNDGKAPSKRPDGTDASKHVCTMHPAIPATLGVNGVPVCDFCLQLVLDMYHEVELRGFYG